MYTAALRVLAAPSAPGGGMQGAAGLLATPQLDPLKVRKPGGGGLLPSGRTAPAWLNKRRTRVWWQVWARVDEARVV